MRLMIHTRFEYHFPKAADALLQIEVLASPEQRVEASHLELGGCAARTPTVGQDGVGERLWVHAEGLLKVDYRATVEVSRAAVDLASLPEVPRHALPAEAIQYLMPSRYCPSDLFDQIAEEAFGDSEGGARALAIRDWVANHLSYTIGSSHSGTTALETFMDRQGVCRDYAHLVIALARTSSIPARMVSVYAPRVDPPDFHAVAELYLGGAWHLIDATEMATPDEMAVIGIGRDAADIAFMTEFGEVEFKSKDVTVKAA